MVEASRQIRSRIAGSDAAGISVESYSGEVKEMKPETLREIAADYLHLAQDAEGKVDALRKRRYAQLIKLAGELLKQKLQNR
jgi:hypothetical protein